MGGDVLELAALHSANLAAGYGDAWAGAEFAYTHGYISFAQSGADTQVLYDRDGLYGSYTGKAVALLKNTQASGMLAGVNTTPALSDKRYLISEASTLSEDSGASSLRKIVLSQAPKADVVLTIAGGAQIAINGQSSATVTFTAANWWVPQTVVVDAQDDLLIEGDTPAPIAYSFASTDTFFNGLSETRSVLVIDNDFQRTIELSKSPSTGNNYIVYDVVATTSAGTYDMGAGTDKLEVSASLWSSVPHIQFFGNTGDDSLSGVGAGDGGTGNDVIAGSAGGYSVTVTVQQTVLGYNASKTVTGTWNAAGFQHLAGGTGNDAISAALTAVAANLAGGEGNDTITGSANGDMIYGDSYNSLSSLISPTLIPTVNLSGDSYAYNNKTSVSAADIQTYYQSAYGLSSPIWWTGATGGFGADLIDAAAGNDTVNAGGGDDTVLGGLGDDSIDAGEGADSVQGGDGADTISGGAGNDTIGGDLGNDVIHAGDGDDRIDAGEGNNTVSGGKGFDRIVLGTLGANVASGGDDNDTLIGAAGADSLSGDAGNDSISGAAGNDTLSGGAGLDTLIGGEGNDSVLGGSEADSLLGQEGNDTLSGEDGDDTLEGAEGADSLLGGLGNDSLSAGIASDTLVGGEGNDTLLGEAGSDSLLGEAGNDSLVGGDEADSLDGGAGNDTLSGGAGNDLLLGGTGTGADVLDGGAGNDTLSGGDGADLLTGGAGADRFAFAFEQLGVSADYITDFSAGADASADKLDLDSVHAGNLATSVPTWPAAQYPYSLGYIRIQQEGPDTVIGYDRDGFNSQYLFKPLVTLANVNANTLTPDNFTTGSQNFGFQRNGALIAINAAGTNSVNYDVRLWGGSPSSAVTVVLTSAQLNTELGRVSYSATDWTATKSITVALANSVRSLEGLTVRIESSDTAYQGSGVVMGMVDGSLLVERIQVAQPELSVFAARTSTRSLELSGLGVGLMGALPSTLDLVPLSGSGPATTASVAVIDSSKVKLTLNALSAAWEGNTEYVALGINASGQAVRFKVAVQQSETYAASIVSSKPELTEGSTGNSLLNVLVQLDKTALSDVAFNWEVKGAGGRAATADDFPGGVFPSGQVTVKAGQTSASLVIPVLGDQVQETDENFSVLLRSASSSSVSVATSPVFRIVDDDKSALVGEVRYWAGNQLINDVGITLIKKVQSANTTDAVMVRNVSVDSATGRMRAELWYEGVDAVSNLNLAFNKNGDASFLATLNPALLNTSQWNLFLNDTADSYKVSGISLQSLTAPFKIMDIQASASAKGQGVVLSGGVVGSQVVLETALMSSLSSMLAGGQVDLDVIRGNYLASLSKSSLPEAARPAIDSRDALMVLKMAMGIALPAGSVNTGYQFLAADVDQNGWVQVKDAWAIARYSIGQTGSAQAGDWMFVDSRADVSTLSAAKSQLLSAPSIDVQSAGSSSVSFVGVALGDVDGSLGSQGYLAI